MTSSALYGRSCLSQLVKIFFHKLHPFLHLASSTSANIAANPAAMRPNEFKQAILTEDTS